MPRQMATTSAAAAIAMNSAGNRISTIGAFTQAGLIQPRTEGDRPSRIVLPDRRGKRYYRSSRHDLPGTVIRPLQRLKSVGTGAPKVKG